MSFDLVTIWSAWAAERGTVYCLSPKTGPGSGVMCSWHVEAPEARRLADRLYRSLLQNEDMEPNRGPHRGARAVRTPELEVRRMRALLVAWWEDPDNPPAGVSAIVDEERALDSEARAVTHDQALLIAQAAIRFCELDHQLSTTWKDPALAIACMGARHDLQLLCGFDPCEPGTCGGLVNG